MLNVLVPVHTVEARAQFQSAEHGDMVIPHLCTVHFGQHSFHSSALSV